MLHGENGSRHKDRHLLTAKDRLVRRSEGNLGLTESNVAAKQSVHGDGAHHILLYFLYGHGLTVRLLIVKGRLKILLEVVVGRECDTAETHAGGIKLN